MASTPKVPDVCARLRALCPTELAGTEQPMENTPASGGCPLVAQRCWGKADLKALLSGWSSARPIRQHYPGNTPHPSEPL